MNEGKGKYNPVALPAAAQFSNIRSVVPIINQSTMSAANPSITGALLLGNFGFNNIEIGRQDANFGTLLQVTKKQPATNQQKNQSKIAGTQWTASQLPGLVIKGEVRRAVPIAIGKEICYVLAKNNGNVQIIKKAR